MKIFTRTNIDTPKRDRGPTATPEKVQLNPKQQYQTVFGVHPTEHTFEKFQFGQATAENGKRWTAQQYFHLLVELCADIGKGHSAQFLKVASRKSARIVVRGRSP